jgi:hypothetical protein
MRIVIDTVGDDGSCRAMIIEAVACDGRMLTVRRRYGETLDVPLSTIADWSPIENRYAMTPLLDRWIERRPELACL